VIVTPSNSDGESKIYLDTTDSNKNLKLILEVIGENIVEAFVYPEFEIENKKYNLACQLANYITIRSNLSFVQVFESTNGLVIRNKSFSTFSQGPVNEDFSNVVYSAMSPVYEYWNLFYYLATTSLNASEIIETFENDGSK